MIFGTSVSFAGYPTGMSKKALSFFGRSKIFSKNPIGLGVCGKQTSPALWIAKIKKPHAIPTDSLT